MLIGGFQKMTMLDFPGRVACTVFTGGCNFRCPFCHNALLVTEFSKEDCLDEQEIFDVLEKRKGLLDGVAITGGEPTLHKDLPDFIRRIHNMGYPVKLDTNGTNPDMIEALIGEGLLAYVAMDIKNSDDKYLDTIGLKAYELNTLKRTRAILDGSGIPHEYRTTVMSEFHTVEDIVAIAGTIPAEVPYFIQKFVDSGELIEEGFTEVKRDIMFRMLEEARKVHPNTELRGVD